MDDDESIEEYKERMDRLFHSWKTVRDECISMGLNPNIKFQDVRLDVEQGREVDEQEREFYIFQKWAKDFTIAIGLEPNFLELEPPIPETSTNSQLLEYLQSL